MPKANVPPSSCARLTASPSLETTVARCFAFVGPYMQLDAHFAIGNFIADALGGGPDPSQGRRLPISLLSLCVGPGGLALDHLFKGRSGRAYNVGSEDALNIAAVAREVAATVPQKMAVKIAGSPSPGAPVHRYVPSHRARPGRIGPARRSALARRHPPYL